MIIVVQDPRSFKLCPENSEESQLLDSWYHREVRVTNAQRTFDQELTGIVLEFGNERQ